MSSTSNVIFTTNANHIYEQRQCWWHFRMWAEHQMWCRSHTDPQIVLPVTTRTCTQAESHRHTSTHNNTHTHKHTQTQTYKHTPDTKHTVTHTHMQTNCNNAYNFRLALYVYEYLLHVGAQKAAQTFLNEVIQLKMRIKLKVSMKMRKAWLPWLKQRWSHVCTWSLARSTFDVLCTKCTKCNRIWLNWVDF